MCVIIIKKSNERLSTEIAKTSSLINPDGLGVVWLDDYSISYHKSSEFKVLDTIRPFIAHFRYATVGKIGKDNTHPFQCGANSDEWLMMNGTIQGIGTHKKTDSKVLAENLGLIPRSGWEKELAKYPCRFVTVNVKTKTYEIYNQQLWSMRGDIWYSKGNVLQEHLVAVYGTLKKGYNNYQTYLTKSTYVGKGVTKDKYPLIIEGLPYVVNRKGIGHNVAVDVFKVSDDKLTDLDRLEGHPNWYQRIQIPIKMANGNVLVCWLYFNPKMISANATFHKAYKQDFRTYTDRIMGYAPKYSPTPQARPEITYKPSRFQDADVRYELDFMSGLSEQDFITGTTPTDFNITEENAMCVDCYSDLEFDGFANYYCKSCGIWFREEEVVKFRE